jgi:hypothetical protein
MRKLKQEPCLECSKIGTYCKKLCQACYSKKQRSTPIGKLKMKLYNDTKGVEARQRYLAKKPQKPLKEEINCECGKVAILKGFCRNCYHKNYWRIRNGWVENPKTGYKKVDYNKVDYNLVLNLVKKGLTITDACKKSKIERSTFYRTITEQQKLELRAYKFISPLLINDDFKADEFLM